MPYKETAPFSLTFSVRPPLPLFLSCAFSPRNRSSSACISRSLIHFPRMPIPLGRDPVTQHERVLSNHGRQNRARPRTQEPNAFNLRCLICYLRPPSPSPQRSCFFPQRPRRSRPSLLATFHEPNRAGNRQRHGLKMCIEPTLVRALCLLCLLRALADCCWLCLRHSWPELWRVRKKRRNEIDAPDWPAFIKLAFFAEEGRSIAA